MLLEGTQEPENNDTLSMISELRGVEESTTEEPKPAESTPAPSTEETPASDVEKTEEELEQEAEARRTALLREIAMDPALTQQYVQEQYYPPQQAQPVNHQQAPPQTQGAVTLKDAFEQAFPDEEFDITNIDHQSFLTQFHLKPAFDFIEESKQAELAMQQQQEAQYLNQIEAHVNQKAVEYLDTYVPGFTAIADKLSKGQALTPVEKAVFNEAVNVESAYLQYYPQARFDVQTRMQIAQQIGPQIKAYAKELGLVAQPSKTQLTPEQKQVMKQESYVESSSAVPAQTGGSFEKAHQSGDPFQMIVALRQQ